MSTTWALVVTVILLAGNAFFVGAEFAITSSRRAQLEPLAAEGNARARTALWALEHVSAMLATAQLGVTLCSTGLGVVAEPALAHMLAHPLAAIGLGEATAHAIAVIIALTFVVMVHVLAGEMVPKNLAIASPEKAALIFAPPLVALSRFFNPAVVVLNGIANSVLRLLGIEPKDEVSAAFTAQEVASIVERSRAEGVLADDTGLLSGALEFSEETAGSVMVPLDELITLPDNCTPEDVEREVAKTGYSRYPLVCASTWPGKLNDDGDYQHGGVDERARSAASEMELVGYIHLKDVLYADGDERQQPVPAWLCRALVPVHAQDDVEDVLAAMQATGAHVGYVLDENEKTTGVVFLEDILEELVGEVRDAMQRDDKHLLERIARGR
ncbi:hemolysin family protein [Actinomyces vulturis]|uniref:hemolysin family protein n=1 Tax=Actinomyces vulturis TaxID=1857645 RepID=UPI0008309F05|nr:hemolysin family protein [Actinomyces vulturis]